ncbi:putative NADH-ubiquinone oxidoreductase 17.8 kDa subunit [Venustampulla echinocandica]|uniref:Putative NADH-ubiquinone oxidoreductase 17.8 kDa subunit n=1 Tax=Venustampulla echinocandica TaxID=2656787 RepID=A0A370TSS4_9HELO|nr:putative NADH-ubiquinone oxidoreductase 17.8 kDa subunit [Venustampulla echinocandica]RDL38553.1 putative NADH-ubiquinone oxidoreductase 17.8 kDa subunit [Venustampulla echinocandica]
MIPLRRKAVQAAERLPVAASRTIRQYSAKQPAKTGDHVHHSAGSSTDHGHHSAGPKSESFGVGFYVVLVAIPVSIGVYTASRPGEDGKLAGFSSFIDSYSYYREKWAAQNALHTAAIQQAGFDKNLYHNSTGTKHIDLRFPEIFNTGSPYNGVAGHRARNMDELVAHYEKLNTENEERKVKALAEKSG